MPPWPESKYNPSPAQEAQWNRHKACCYRRWRADFMQKCVRYIEDASTDAEHNKRWAHITSRMNGVPGTFLKDLANAISMRAL